MIWICTKYDVGSASRRLTTAGTTGGTTGGTTVALIFYRWPGEGVEGGLTNTVVDLGFGIVAGGLCCGVV